MKKRLIDAEELKRRFEYGAEFAWCDLTRIYNLIDEMPMAEPEKPIEKAEVKESEPYVKTVVLEPDVTPEDLENDEGIQYCVGPSDNGKGIIISVYSKDHCIRLNNKTDLRNLVDAIIEASQMEE